jgi:hypothetical protein
VKSEKPVKVFLDRNHEHQGRMAGYESHAHDMLPIYKAELQASFRASLERMIELAEIDLLEIRTQVIEVGDAIPSVRQKLELRVQMLQSNIEEMRMQKILSVDDEGLMPRRFNRLPRAIDWVCRIISRNEISVIFLCYNHTLILLIHFYFKLLNLITYDKLFQHPTVPHHWR